MPELVSSIRELREKLLPYRRVGKSIGFVPTMGALHAGHRRLLEIARQETDVVVASIFVNPLQFDRAEDLGRYPRTLDQDLVTCADAGVDFVFLPPPSEMYPGETLVTVDLRSLTDTLCGPHRPGHFRGVATVVLKLFEIVLPDLAYFGEKDAQQLAIIRRMVGELNVPVKVVAVETVREPDGLALSSRNQLLTAEQRRIAPVLSQALFSAREMVERGESSVEAILGSVVQTFARYSEIRLEYFEIVDPGTLALVPRVTGPVLIAGAIWLGSVRLIDNLTATPAAHLSP
jgi:pantoate--beta-alanine ligase